MSIFSESALAAAVDQVLKGQSIRSVAEQYHVSRTTIKRRIDGVTPKELAHSHRERLSPTLEKGLADWILTQGRLDWAPPHSRFRWFAQRLLINSGHSGVVGKHWHTKFLKR